ncbi:probable LRR receptor-like serine/threonine-protein kinase At1g14390 [Punica granatum]|uniref:non-specific serine/threonine protein kinase n=1 Tax=Punica granatum TaxID=22663 RepID=A0A6P8E818_PUNGR|nr:probable LRR receptor-like serine/threonine-protein kinase At1g14390 [Punica granatum]
MGNRRVRDLCFSVNFVLVFGILVRPSVSQLIPTETRALFQAQRLLEYPEALQGWNNWTNFCYLPPSPSLTIVCSNNHVTELTIVGNKTSPSRAPYSGLRAGKFYASNQTLSQTFLIESLFTVLTKLSNLQSLSLVSLGLWGQLPTKINRFHSLESLNLSSNFIYGEIPQSITTFKSLSRLALDDNLFNGSVPDLKLLGVLMELDLSSNSLGPEFPSLGDSLVNVSLRNNSFKSEIPPVLGNFIQLCRFDASYNKLVGPFPSWIFSLPSVQYINLAENQLGGTIRINLSCSGNLTYVDISHNLLVGKLPPCMSSNITNRTVITSWNCLSSGDRKYQHSDSYCRKEALAVQPQTGSSTTKKEARIKLGLILGIIGGTVVATAALGLLILCIIRRAKERRSSGDDKTFNRSFADELSFRWSPKLSVDSRRVPQTMRMMSIGLPSYHVYTLEDIEEATNNFDPCNLMTEASQGQMYKGWLRDGSVVLVKCLKIKQRHLPQNLNQQMEILSKLRHRHLVSILGHCIVTYQDHPNISSTVFILLEYVSNGSLKDYLTDWRKKETLKWPQRMTIMIGIARGVQFLHAGVATGVFGNDLKIENILLDDSLTAKISGYKIPLPFKTGSENSINDQDSSDPPGNEKDAEKEDVYQLGKILLQIILGKLVKSPSELGDQRQMLEWSLTEHPTQLRTATDPSIRGTYAFQSLKTAVEVAVNCLEKEPRKRPSIEDVLWNLQYSIQVQEGWTSSENLSTRT